MTASPSKLKALIYGFLLHAMQNFSKMSQCLTKGNRAELSKNIWTNIPCANSVSNFAYLIDQVKCQIAPISCWMPTS